MAIILMIMLILAHQELQHMKKTVMISSMIKFLRRREGESRTRLSNKHIIMINIPSSDFCCIFTIYFHNHLTQQLSAPGLDSLAIPCHTVRQGSPNNQNNCFFEKKNCKQRSKGELLKGVLRFSSGWVKMCAYFIFVTFFTQPQFEA